jgi:hypothetical protein
MTEAAATRQEVWQATIPGNDPDLVNHLLDLADGREFAFEGRDLSPENVAKDLGNPLDTNPATIAARDPATGAFKGYEMLPNSEWKNRIVDHNYKVRIDTQHDRKPELPPKLEPAK